MKVPRPIVSLLLLLTAGCASASSAQREPERRSLEVSLAVPTSVAFNKVRASFVREGLVVAQADRDAGILVTVPRVSGGMITVATVYRANILSAGDSASSVILSGGYTSKDVDRLAGAVSGASQPVLSDEKPLTSKMNRTLGEAWKLLERIAGELQPPVTRK